MTQINPDKNEISREVIDLALHEIRAFRLGEREVCSLLFHRGKPYAVVKIGEDRANARGALVAIDANGDIWSTLTVDGLTSLDDCEFPPPLAGIKASLPPPKVTAAKPRRPLLPPSRPAYHQFQKHGVRI